ncbi:S26 family signal peptidase [Halostella pelagica]|uniref:S26 family signal peptidase n=1 Tax=Halostella pelagica TaxID=2583824 RepID=UPI001081AAA7|nr:S26 family signal peptidase [Halostella pelagica]
MTDSGDGDTPDRTPQEDDPSGEDGSTAVGSDRAPPSKADSHGSDRADADQTAEEPSAAPGYTAGDDEDERASENPVTWFLTSDNEGVAALRDLLSTMAIVALVGLLLFAVSGIWPPLVAVESGSMEPHMEKNDLVFIVDEDRFAGDGAVHGVVTYQRGIETDERSFGSYGDVIVFKPNGDEGIPIIHRARFYVEKGENWVSDANESHIRGDTCEEVRNCPAPHDGFITKGDDTPYYDQVAGRTTVVKPKWIEGRAEVRIPWLGWIRLQFAKL